MVMSNVCDGLTFFLDNILIRFGTKLYIQIVEIPIGTNCDNVYFDNMISQIYPSELQLNKANTSVMEAAFLYLHLSISNDIVSTKIYDKRDDFDFEIANFPFLDGNAPRSTSYGVILNSFVLLEHLAILLTSTLAINC